MKKILLIIFSFVVLISYSQGPPPPLGCNPFYVLDDDNDGIAVFNVDWYMQNVVMPSATLQAGADLSGYTPQMYPSESDYNAGTNLIVGPLYTNVSNNQFVYIDFVYNGNGPVFTNNGFYMLVHSACHVLTAIPFDGDEDNDGISNSDEDTNANGYLNDDDDDNDGLINLYDLQTLGLSEFADADIRIFPNPVANGFITFEATIEMSTVSIFNISGQRMDKVTQEGHHMYIDFPSGVYFLKFVFNGKPIVKKLIVK